MIPYCDLHWGYRTVILHGVDDDNAVVVFVLLMMTRDGDDALISPPIRVLFVGARRRKVEGTWVESAERVL